MQHLEGLVRKAVQDYEMIQPGDKICVGVSGGKDSVVLTVALGRLRRYLGISFDVFAVTLDPCFGGVETDYAPLAALFAAEGIPYEIRRTDIGPVVFDYRKEPNPCALCAKLRRGTLHTAAKELGCNKIALGHHLDDAIETFYMNLWREGRIGCFAPVTYLSRRDLTMIRPLLLATESEVRSAVHKLNLPIIKSRCPADGVTVREDTKQFVNEMVRKDPAFRQKSLNALQQSGIDGWAPAHTGRDWNPAAQTGAHPLPMEFDTPRLRLRRFRNGDLQDLLGFLGDAAVAEPTGHPPLQTATEARTKLKQLCITPDCYALEEKATGKVVGLLNIKPDSEDGRSDTRELGFALRTDRQRKGYMSEAIQAVLAAMLGKQTGIDKIYACCFMTNAASRGLIESLGFVFAQEGSYHIEYLDKTVPSLEYLYTRELWKEYNSGKV